MKLDCAIIDDEPLAAELLASYARRIPELNLVGVYESAVTAMGYDAYYFALQAIQNAGSTDPADIMDALWTTEIDGVTGHIALDDVNGDAIRNTVYVKHANTTTGGWDALPAVVVD